MQTVQIIKHVAEIIKQRKSLFDNVLVVVSAMAKHTNQLVEFVDQCQPTSPNKHWNIDSVIASGEQITAGLLALCLQNAGIEALSLASWQIPIQTDQEWSNANITSINTELLTELFDQGVVPVITGFQGVTDLTGLTSQTLKVHTTLGRGGSDTTAVAIACALSADRCEIFTDVPGVFTADPNKIPHAKLIPYIDYHFLEKLALAGAKVVHPQAARLASEHQIDLSVLSTFAPQGTQTKVVDSAPQPACLVYKEITGISGKLNQIPEEALYHTYNHLTQEFTGFFEDPPHINNLVTDLHYSKPYKLTILNPSAKMSAVNLDSLMLKEGIECHYISPYNQAAEDITLIIDSKFLNKAMTMLYSYI